MSWFHDWQYTGRSQWFVVKQCDGFVVERYCRERVDMNSGERQWYNNTDIMGFYEDRVRAVPPPHPIST